MTEVGTIEMGIRPTRPVRIVALLCVAEVLSMTAFATYPALLPVIRNAWALSNTEAGLISGTFFAGYALAVPVLTGLTDRVDPRRVYLLSTGLSAAGALAFATLADGLVSALAAQMLLGAGLAGTYMPGLKALADRIDGPTQSRSIAFYTSTFGLGTSLSLWLAGRLSAAAGWRVAFAVAAAGPVIAGALIMTGLSPARPPHRASSAGGWRALLRVFANREASAYIASYAGHCWELFGLRAWLVAFFTYYAARQPSTRVMWAPATIAAGLNLLGPAASILGNELGTRTGRGRVVIWMMGASAVLSCGVGVGSVLPPLLLMALTAMYFLAVMGDSATVTAGAVAAAVPGQRGATMAMHSLLGFGAGFVAPLVFGGVIDVFGGSDRPVAWMAAFATLGAGSVAGLTAFVLLRARHAETAHEPPGEHQ